jgi:hypothetical protein
LFCVKIVVGESRNERKEANPARLDKSETDGIWLLRQPLASEPYELHQHPEELENYADGDNTIRQQDPPVVENSR